MNPRKARSIIVTPYFDQVAKSLASEDLVALCDDAERRAPSRSPRRPESLLAWGRRYLPEHFTLAPSLMHLWLEEQLGGMLARRGTKVNAIGPRGGAKSTIGTLAYPLRVALEGWERYIWIISDTKHQARAHLENLKSELTDNARLAKQYPTATGEGVRFRENAVVLPGGVTVEAFGTGQRIRGRRRRADRPTLIVCDDLQNDGHVVSAWQRERSRAWFHGMLLKAGTHRTNVVNLATALHRDALAMELHRTPGWTSRTFRAIERWPDDMLLWQTWEAIYCQREGDGRREGEAPAEPELRDGCHFSGSAGASPSQPAQPGAVPSRDVPPPSQHGTSAREAARAFYDEHRAAMDAGAELLWPAEEDLYTLMCMRAESGRTAFEREKQSSPVNPELCEWPETYFDQTFGFDEWPEGLRVRTIALDPSKGRDARHGDYSAFVLLGIDDRGVIYVEADLARRPVDQIVAEGVELCRRFRPDAFGIEANQFQELLGEQFVREFERQGLLGIRPWTLVNDVNKLVRIRRLSPHLAVGRLRFKANSPSTSLLCDQLKEFPIGDHDDGPDALEMALRLAGELLAGSRVDDGLGERLIVG